MASFLATAEAAGLNILKVIAPALGPIIGSFAGPAAPLVSSVATSIVTNIISAEQSHMTAKAAASVTPGAVVVDVRKETVVSNITAFMPVIEALASVTGHPIPDKAKFEAALPLVIDATVAELNALTALYAALHA